MSGVAREYIRNEGEESVWHHIRGLVTMILINFEEHIHLLGNLLSCIAESDVGCYLSLREVCIGNGFHLIVSDMHQRTHPQLHRTEDATQSPHILALKI